MYLTKSTKEEIFADNGASKKDTGSAEVQIAVLTERINNLIEHFKYSNGLNGSSVEHYRIDNGNHIWFNFSYEGKNTNQIIWNFLAKHTLEENY